MAGGNRTRQGGGGQPRGDMMRPMVQGVQPRPSFGTQLDRNSQPMNLPQQGPGRVFGGLQKVGAQLQNLPSSFGQNKRRLF